MLNYNECSWKLKTVTNIEDFKLNECLRFKKNFWECVECQIDFVKRFKKV